MTKMRDPGAGSVELVLPESARPSAASFDAQRRLHGVVRATRLQLHALQIASFDPDAATPPVLRERLVAVVAQLHDMLHDLAVAAPLPAGSPC
jgi:hypothetical protein